MIKDVMRDFVFGMEDGLVSNLGLVLGVYVGGGSPYAIVLAGLASMFAGAFSMSAGSYLSAKSQREVYEHETKQTLKELEKNPKACYSQMKTILKKEGLNQKQIKALLTENKKFKHPEFVCNYLVQRKVGISKEKYDLPFKNAITMFFSYLAGAIFPIFPFIVATGMGAAVTALVLTIIVLFAVGWIKTYYTGRNWFKSGMEIVVVGLLAGVVGYVVGWVLSLI